MKTFWILLVGILALPITSLWYGYVLSILWAWFVVPAFHVAPLSILLAIGVSIVVRMFTSSYTESNDKKDEDKAGQRMFGSIFYALLYPLFALAFGAIIHAFL